MSLIQWLLSWLIPDSRIPPAASEYTEEHETTDWKDRPHNASVTAVVNKQQAVMLKQIDITAKKRYDQVDRHVQELRDMKDKLRARRLAKQIKKPKKLEAKPDTA